MAIDILPIYNSLPEYAIELSNKDHHPNLYYFTSRFQYKDYNLVGKAPSTAQYFSNARLYIRPDLLNFENVKFAIFKKKYCITPLIIFFTEQEKLYFSIKML